MKCSSSIFDVFDGGSERVKEVCVVCVENDLIFVVIAPCPSVLCEEVLDECGSVLQGRVGEIEGGSHGGRVFLRGLFGVLVWLFLAIKIILWNCEDSACFFFG